jgi:hypothetical protein
MKKTISFILFALLVKAVAIAQPPPEPKVLGVWYGRCTGYDPQTKSNITVTRWLTIEEENRAYSDTLWGQPTDLDSIIFELEIGNWNINLTQDSIIFTPTISKRIDISNPDSLVEYDHGVHMKKLNEDINVWPFHDDNMNVDYSMYKEEFIDKPETPSGNTTPEINKEYTYTTDRTTSNLDHNLEYSFDWGDGSNSDWSSDTSASHSWGTEGIKYVTVTARCQEHLNKFNTSDSLEVNVLETVTEIPDNHETDNPYSFRLLHDYPVNPVSPVIINYNVPEHTRIILSVFNMHGQLVKTLVNRPQSSGNYEILWDGIDQKGNIVSGGVYLFKFETKDYFDIQKGLLIR